MKTNMTDKAKHSQKPLVAILLAVAVIIAVLPLFMIKNASFGGTDDAGGEIIGEINQDYEPWATPPLERLLKGELPGEVESTLFCVQTGIGVGIIAFIMGRFVERRKWLEKYGQEEGASEKKRNGTD